MKTDVFDIFFKVGGGGKPAAIVFFLVVFIMPTAQAADPIIAMREFGLLGTWDQDCTAPITDAMRLIRFTETSLGVPRMIVSHPDDIIYETTIDAATVLQPDKIQLTIESGLGPPAQLTFQLTGLSLQLKTILPTPLLHRCISE